MSTADWKRGGVHAQDITVQAVKCNLCEGRILLRLQPRQPETAWRWFECPHCHKPNFARLPGLVIEVTKDRQEA